MRCTLTKREKLFIENLQSAVENTNKVSNVNRKKLSVGKINEIADMADDERLNRLLADNKLRVFGEKNTSVFWEMVRGDNSVVLGSAGETAAIITGLVLPPSESYSNLVNFESL